MKSGETGVVILEHDIEMSNVSEIIITLSSVAGEIEKRLSQKEVEIKPNNKILIPLSQDDTIRLSRKTDTEVKVEGQIVFDDNPPTVCKTEIVSFRLEATLNTEHVPGANGVEGQYIAISIRCHAGVIYANLNPENVEALVNEKVSEAFENGEIIAGANGKDGKDGVDGSDGKSAYELAVENGFTGTVEEWLDSLKGKDGTNGKDGKDGVDGTGTAAPDYPTYAKTEMESVLLELQQYYNIDNPIVIGFSTDQHVNSPNKENEIIPQLRTMRDLTKLFPFNICVLGGDSYNSSDVADMSSGVQRVTNALDGANCPVFHLVGNHDGKQDILTISSSAVFMAHRTNAIKDKVATTIDRSTNCYYDDNSVNVRFIMLCSQGLNGYGIEKTKAFLSNALATLPQDYEAIIFSHHPLGNLADDTSTRVNDWNEPLGWGNIVNPYASKIICCIDGHVHADKSEILDGILYLSTTCAGNSELNDGSTRTLGTADFTAYDVFVIDRATYTIHAVRYGNGNNRDISYYTEPVVSYTNVIPLSQDTDGSIYNSVGYKTDTRLNTNAEERTKEGCGITGFIPVKSGDVIRLKNVQLYDGDTDHDYLGFFNTNHAIVYHAYPNRYNGADTDPVTHVTDPKIDFTEDSNNYITQFTVPDDSNIAYMRISANGVNEEAIITINEAM